MRRTRFLTAATLALLAAGFASAQMADYKREIGARQGLMRLYAHELGTLGAMAKGAMPYDAAAAQTAADNLALLSKVNSASMWPAGSDMDHAQGTKAKAALWENFPDVGAKGAALREAADAMAAVAGTDLASLQAAMGPLGGACGGCHKAYRAKE